MYLPMSGPNPRKRPAPGASPIVPVQPMQQPYTTSPQDQVLRWTGGVADPNSFAGASQNVGPYVMNTQAQYAPSFPQPSTAIARRTPNRALVPTNPRPPYDAASELWAGFGDDSGLIQAPNGGVDEHDNIELLEEKAQVAKREAQAKRKQIPPFVQKLSSFLEEQKNTDLIRWSDKGDSFVVLDEDEFAKTLIPELFKHNNYASFVRQLNMYGFHKRVGLSDNSMKASERKNKSPSEYYNPYFKRGHPNLLWLINKPKGGNKSKKGKKEDGDPDSEEEVGMDEPYAQTFPGPSTQPARAAPPGEIGPLQPLQRKDLQLVKDQINAIKSQQARIEQSIATLQFKHNQQAHIFKEAHQRHEHSINAILNFLANVFRKSLEEQGGVQTVSELLASILPNSQMPQVVHLGDFDQQQTPVTPTMGTPKRQQRLLPPIPPQGRASTVASPASHASPSSSYPSTGPSGQVGSVTELADTPTDTTSPSYLKQELQANPQESMMRIIHDTNASNRAPVNLPEVAANTPVNITSDQQRQMLNLLASRGRTAPSPQGPNTVNPTTVGPAPLSMPPAFSMPTSTGQPLSLSPILSSIQPPSVRDMANSEADIEALKRMQEEQKANINDLSQLLGPLSPLGRIPGVSDTDNVGGQGQSYFGDKFDLDQYLDSNAFGDDFNFGTADLAGEPPVAGVADGNDFNFSLDNSYDPNAAGQVAVGAGETQSTETTPSPTATEEITRDDLDEESPEPDPKRRRV